MVTLRKNPPNRYLKNIAFLSIFIFLQLPVFSQQYSGDNSDDQNSYQANSFSQINELEKQAKAQGYTPEQIAELKRKHASQSGNAYQSQSQQYFSEYTKPIKYDDSSVSALDSLSGINTGRGDSLESEKTDSSLAIIDDTLNRLNNLPFFGYAIFNKTPDAFKPNAFGPVDPGYLVGPGDIMRLSVWGEVEFQYELKVNRDGKIFIPVAGQLYVTGIPFEKLQSKIQSILSKHYSGLASTPQKSFLDLSIAQIHPIRIFMMGEVKAPGGYTVSTSSTAFNAFYSISGPLTSGSLRDISIIRDQKEIAKLDLYEYFTTGKCTTDVRLLNDDVVFTPRRGKTVAITGSVFRPAIYELKESEKLISLLTYCGGILPQSNGGRALIKRVVPIKDRTADNPVRKVLDVDLQKLLIDSVDVDLCDKDTIEISPLSDELKNFATISGAVHYPGMYQVENLSLYTLIFSLGKPIETKAFTGRADLIRRNEDKVSFTTLPIDLKQLLADSATQDQFLQPFDEVIIYEKQVEKPIDLLITIDGEVRNPGSYTLSSNQTVIDALLRAGGFTREAYRNIVNVFRLHLSKNGSDTITETFNISLPDSIDFNAPRDNQFTLHDRDKIVVRPNADYITDNYVTIEGLVKFRGKYAIKVRGERLSDLIFRAGGLLPDAFLEGATVTRNKQRVVVNFAEALSGQSSKENLLLQKNDIITIPPRPNTVLVSGNVNNPGLFSYVENSKVRTYIDRAGGLADSSTVILLTSPGGETAKVRKISFKNPMVKDGSTIFVLKKRPRDLSKEKQGPTVTEVIRDTLAIMASAFTVIGLAIQMRK